jgi:hypothetical protein
MMERSRKYYFELVLVTVLTFVSSSMWAQYITKIVNRANIPLILEFFINLTFTIGTAIFFYWMFRRENTSPYDEMRPNPMKERLRDRMD